MNRRIFAQRLAAGVGLIAAMGSTVVLTGCSLFNQILAYVGVGLQSFQSIVDLLAGAGLIPIGTGTAVDLIIALVKAGFADLQTAVNNYEAAPASNKVTLEGKISTAVAVLQNSVQKFWSDLEIPDPKLASTVQGLCGIILSTLAGFATQLPPAPAGAVKGEAPKKMMTVSAQKRTTSQYKKDFNKILVDNGYPAVNFK